MRNSSRIAALLLLGTLSFALPCASVAAALSPHAGHPAGCHHPMPGAPSPVPVSHQCCVAGQQSAMPVASFSQHPPAAQFCAACGDQQIALTSLRVHGTALSLILPGSPPDAAPLRI
jgi:hypothetical protein